MAKSNTKWFYQISITSLLLLTGIVAGFLAGRESRQPEVNRLKEINRLNQSIHELESSAAQLNEHMIWSKPVIAQSRTRYSTLESFLAPKYSGSADRISHGIEQGLKASEIEMKQKYVPINELQF